MEKVISNINQSLSDCNRALSRLACVVNDYDHLLAVTYSSFARKAEAAKCVTMDFGDRKRMVKWKLQVLNNSVFRLKMAAYQIKHDLGAILFNTVIKLANACKSTICEAKGLLSFGANYGV